MKRSLCLGVLLTFSSLAMAAAPRLVRSEPANGAKGVAPNIGVIRLFFDQDMSDGHTLWGSDRGPFPPPAGKDAFSWASPRIFEMKIQPLKPNTTYAFQVNSAKRQAFKSAADGTPVAPAPVMFTTGGGGPGGEWVTYRHLARRFVIRMPKGWRVLRGLEDGDSQYVITPEPGKTKLDDVDAGIMLTLLGDDPASPVAERGPVDTLKHFLPLIRHKQPGLALAGGTREAKLGKLAAAVQRAQGTVEGKTGQRTAEVYLAKADGLMYLVVAIAPRDQFRRLEPTFARILSQSQFGYIFTSRRGPRRNAADVIEQYKESVVSILIEGYGSGGSGTGFIIHEDGYVATNAHVAWFNHDQPAQRKPWQKYEVEWDRSLKRRKLPATFVGARWLPSRSPRIFMWKSDVALLKLPPGKYKPIPLSALRDIKQGDPLLTLGFPQRDLFASLDLFTTTGDLTRFNRDCLGQVESYYTTAKIAHGSSGGPCIDLATGGVLGLNTFSVPPGALSDPRSQPIADLVGYFGVIPIEALMAEFPLVAELGINPDTARLHFLNYYEVAKLAFARGWHGGAARVAAMAARANPDSADAHCLLGASTLEKADTPQLAQQGIASLNRALACDAGHEGALLRLAQAAMEGGKGADALQYATRAVQAHPNSLESLATRAAVQLELARYDDAIADAHKAKQLARGVVAEPCILAGRIRYQQNRLEEGRTEFAEAVKIHPTNLDAWMGLGEYHERKNQAAAALAQYTKIAAKFPRSPAASFAMARCHRALRQSNDAWRLYHKSFSQAQNLGVPPIELAIVQATHMALTERKKLDDALPLFHMYFLFYGYHPRAVKMHAECGNAILHFKWRPAVAHAHYRRGLALKPGDPDAKKYLNEQVRLSLDDIVAMLKEGRYLPMVAAQLIEVTPLTFGLRTREDALKLARLGIPKPVFEAILKSNKRFPPKKGNGPPPNLKALVGTWAGKFPTPQGVMGHLVTVLRADGTFSSRLAIAATGGYPSYINSHGTWKADARLIHFSGQDATRGGVEVTKTYSYQLDARTGRIIINTHPVAGPAPAVLTKQR